MTKAGTIPQDIVDEILDHLASADSDLGSLRTCALVSKSWVQPSRRHLFHTAVFTSMVTDRWLKTFPMPEWGPAHYVKDLCIRVEGGRGFPERFCEHLPWFKNVEKMSLMSMLPYQMPLLERLPQSVTSLAIKTDSATVLQLRDILVQLPNLDNLSLSGHPLPVVRRALPGIGTVLGGRFGGRLVLRGGWAGGDVINMLLEIPTGLHFSEVQIWCTRRCLPSAVGLVQTCNKTLVKLSQTVTFDYGYEYEISRSFDFSKFPNLQEVTFGFRVGWKVGGLPWIPMALSTLRPATSPRLSAVRLDLAGSDAVNQPIEAVIEDTAHDFRRIVDEVARIELEFKGAVNFSVLQDSVFEEVLGTLDILQRHSRCNTI